MDVINVNGFIGGWFVGDFAETAYRTPACEVSYKKHAAGEYWPAHYHAQADEINYLITGKMEINGTQLEGPVVFVIHKNEIAKPMFHTDVTLIVVKLPSLPGDKILV